MRGAPEHTAQTHTLRHKESQGIPSTALQSDTDPLGASAECIPEGSIPQTETFTLLCRSVESGDIEGLWWPTVTVPVPTVSQAIDGWVTQEDTLPNPLCPHCGEEKTQRNRASGSESTCW